MGSPPPQPTERSLRPPAIGTLIGRYRLERLLGKGGMGAVFGVVDSADGSQWALKILRPLYSYNPKLVRRFFNEAKAVMQIDHPNVVRIYDFGTSDEGYCFLRMERLDGLSLLAELRKGGKLELGRACRIAGQIARALAASHALGIVHRDLKPENVFLINRDGDPDFVKVLDFGIAKLLQRSKQATEQTETGMVLGTMRYMSPEQCRSSKGIDHRSDIYSFGLLVYILIAGRMPFDAETPGDMLIKHVTERPRPITDTVPNLPPVLVAAIERALEKDPAARFQRMDDFGDVLAQFGGPARAPGQEPLAPREAPIDESESTSVDDEAGDDLGDDDGWRAGPTSLSDEFLHEDEPRPSGARPGPTSPSPTVVGKRAGHRRGPSAGLVATFVIVAAAGGAWFAGAQQWLAPPAPSPPSAPAPRPIAPASRAELPAPTLAEPPPAPAEVKLHLASRPPGARLFVDGKPAGATPLDLSRPASHTPLQIRFTFAGFHSLETLVVPDENRALDVSLVPRSTSHSKQKIGNSDILAPNY